MIVAGFGGDRTKYWAAVKAAKLTLGDARAIIAARLERDEVEARFRAPAPSPPTIADFLATYRDQQVRLVSTTRAGALARRRHAGLGRSRRSPRASSSPSPGPGKIDTADGTFEVTPASPAIPLGLLPHGEAVEAAREALCRLTREPIYRGWLRDAGDEAPRRPPRASTTRCRTSGETDLSPFVPFLFAAS